MTIFYCVVAPLALVYCAYVVVDTVRTVRRMPGGRRQAARRRAISLGCVLEARG